MQVGQIRVVLIHADCQIVNPAIDEHDGAFVHIAGVCRLYILDVDIIGRGGEIADLFVGVSQCDDGLPG